MSTLGREVTIYPQVVGRLVIEAAAHIQIGEAIDDGRHIAQQHPRTVALADQHDVLEIVTLVGLAAGLQADVAGLGLDGARRQVEGGGADSVHHIVEAQAIAAQGVL